MKYGRAEWPWEIVRRVFHPARKLVRSLLKCPSIPNSKLVRSLLKCPSIPNSKFRSPCGKVISYYYHLFMSIQPCTIVRSHDAWLPAYDYYYYIIYTHLYISTWSHDPGLGYDYYYYYIIYSHLYISTRVMILAWDMIIIIIILYILTCTLVPES